MTYSEDEVKKLEDQVAVEIAEGDAPTDPNAPADFVAKTTSERPEIQGSRRRRRRLQPRLAGPGQLGDARQRRGPHIRPDHPERPVRPRSPGSPQWPPHQMPPGSGAFDNYERRSAGERCIVSFGRNGGPPMLANGFYNNNYQIVQTPDYVTIIVDEL